ncbi:hypothetical protein [Tenacibaculum finnmarkense]|uniref:hypothetical protein n=1 Tax=Tenacibaculum finnmarkense TaxID=2781243 RepID=UPI003BB75562
MVILLKNGFSHLKLVSGTRKINPVWYNHLSKNRKALSILYNAMYRRFQASEYANAANMVNFYSNTTGELVVSIKV